MQSTTLDARTVAIVRDLQVEQKNGANGQFESKSILFRIAVDRPYKVTRQENGKTISENPTDFWLAKATGNVAQTIADYCTAKKEDGKLVSRRLLLNGNFENYLSPRKIHVAFPVIINGLQYNVENDVDVPNNQATIFIVNEMKFLDSNPANKNNGNASVATPTGTATATPVGATGQPVQGGTVQGGAATATTAGTVQGAPVQAMDGAMNAPVVDGSFVAEGQTAPF